MKIQDIIVESRDADAKQVLDYIHGTHHESLTTQLQQAVLSYPRWELRSVPLSSLHIPDQEYDDEDQEPEEDPYNRVQVIDPDHAGEYSANFVDRRPIVVDSEGWIIDGNHRAWAAAELLNRSTIQAWVPASQLNELGNAPAEYKPNRRRKRSLFHATVDNHWVDVFFDRSEFNDTLHITFAVNGNYDAPEQATSASKSTVRILSTVLNIVKKQLPEYMAKARPPAVSFTSKQDNRTTLYRRYFVPVIQDILGPKWQHEEYTSMGMTVFHWRPEKKQNVQEESVNPANTLYFFDVAKGGRSFDHLDLRIMGLKQSQKGRWYWQPGRDSTDLLTTATLKHLEKTLNVPARPWQRPTTESRIIDPKRVDVYYRPVPGSRGRRVVARNIPATALEPLLQKLSDKYSVPVESFEWTPTVDDVDESLKSKLAGAALAGGMALGAGGANAMDWKDAAMTGAMFVPGIGQAVKAYNVGKSLYQAGAAAKQYRDADKDLKALVAQQKALPKQASTVTYDPNNKDKFELEPVDEAFDQPYAIEWTKQNGDWHAAADLDDGSELVVLFMAQGDNQWMVEFERDENMEITGEGDAPRVFATVLTAMQQFIAKRKPAMLNFSAEKEDDPTGSRARLYDRMIHRYITGTGYDLTRKDVLGGATYTLTKQAPGVAEGKIKLYTDPGYFGAEVDDAGFDSLPIVNISADRLVGFEPDNKMNQPKSKANVEKIVTGLKQGAKLPPLLVRKYKDGYQVLDGHHRFWAYKLLGTKSIPSRIVPDKDIEEISKQSVAESVNDYLWHGSRNKHDVLYPHQAVDTGGKEESNKNAVYATPNAKFAIAMGLTTPGSDNAMFPNDPQMVLFKGGIRKGQMVYLHKVPKDLFIKHNGREWYSNPEVKEVKPIEVIAVPVDKWLHLIRQATPKDFELRKKYMKKQGVAENFADGKNPGRKGLSKRMGVNTKASVSSLRKTAKNSSGEKQRMAHWLANMKAGRAKARKK